MVWKGKLANKKLAFKEKKKNKEKKHLKKRKD